MVKPGKSNLAPGFRTGNIMKKNTVNCHLLRPRRLFLPLNLFKIPSKYLAYKKARYYKAGFYLYKYYISDCKTFTATAAPAGIGIVEIETFAIQPVTEFKFGIYEI